MQFLTLYTPANMSGPPDAEHMSKMMKLTEDMIKAGVLVISGGIMSRNSGMKIVRKNGDYTVEQGPVANSSLMPAAGFAILKAASREELIKHVKAFQEVAGDGVSEVIQLMEGPPPSKA